MRHQRSKRRAAGRTAKHGDGVERTRRVEHELPGTTPRCPRTPDLGTQADAAILVFRAGETSRDAAAAALHRLQEDGITVLGSILNDWNPKDTHYGYGAYDYGAYQDQRKS